MKSKSFAQIISDNSEYYSLIENMLNGYAINEIILDYKHEPVDYCFLEVNSAFEKLTGLSRKRVIGKTILDIMPHTDLEWIKLCADVALNQKDITTEYYSKVLKRFYQVRIKSQEKGIFVTIFNDITSLKNANREAERQKESYESLFKNIRVGLIRTSIDEGHIIQANPACAEMFGFEDLDVFLHTSIKDLYKDPQDRKQHRAKLLRNGKLNHAVLQMRNINNKPLTISVSSTLHYEDNLPVWIDSTIQDISKQQRAEERLAMNSVVFEHTLEAVVISDKNHKILTVNKAFIDMTGYTKKEVKGKDFSLLWYDDEDKSNQCDLVLDGLSNEGSWEGEIFKRHKEGHKFPVNLSVIEAHYSKQGALKEDKHYISIFYDITYRKKNEKELYQLAHFDTLTGLSNRHAFMHQLGESLEKAKRNKEKVAVLFMDLDGFKSINDTYGHNAGDEVLITTASRLKNIIRKSDMLARIGGDEFTLIIDNANDTQALSSLAQKMIHTVAQDIQLKDTIVNVTTSIGISIYPDDSLDLECVLKHADNAMYSAKELGKNNVQFFTKELNIDSVNQMIFEMELRHALEKEEIKISYQPRVSLETDQIIGFEAELYWENEAYGKVLAEDFLPIALKTNMIYDINAWAIHEAISQIKQWQIRYSQDYTLSLSLCDDYLESSLSSEAIEKALHAYELASESFQVQIKQNHLMNEKTFQQLQIINKLGVSIIIENFGLGVSSIADLCKLPIFAFKVDESLSKDQEKILLEPIIQLSHSLKSHVIIPDITDKEELEHSKKHQCEYAQGPHLYPSADAQEISQLLSKR
ncbi:diguanylate cyclase domain-containing protein [Campylobacterota bacterium]